MSRFTFLTLLLLGSALPGCRAAGAPALDGPPAPPESLQALGPAPAATPQPSEASELDAQAAPSDPAAAPQALEASASKQDDSPNAIAQALASGPLETELAVQRDALRDAQTRYKRLSPTAQQGAFGQSLLTEIRALQDEVERLANKLGLSDGE